MALIEAVTGPVVYSQCDRRGRGGDTGGQGPHRVTGVDVKLQDGEQDQRRTESL